MHVIRCYAAYCPFLRLDVVLLLAFCCVENISTCLPELLFEHAKKVLHRERKLWGVIKLTVDKKSIKSKVAFMYSFELRQSGCTQKGCG